MSRRLGERGSFVDGDKCCNKDIREQNKILVRKRRHHKILVEN
jgi:hypothetical protein